MVSSSRLCLLNYADKGESVAWLLQWVWNHFEHHLVARQVSKFRAFARRP
jgi:hypothetical protein